MPRELFIPLAIAILTLFSGCTPRAAALRQDTGSSSDAALTETLQVGTEQSRVSTGQTTKVPDTVTPMASVTSTLSSFASGEIYVAGSTPPALDIALSDEYLYYIPLGDSTTSILCRVALAGGPAEVIYVSKYWNSQAPLPTDCSQQSLADGSGQLGLLAQSDDWLMFADLELPLVYARNAVIAYHIPTAAFKVIVEGDVRSASGFSLHKDTALLGTLQGHDDSDTCPSESILQIVDLPTGDVKDLYRSCINGAWNYPLSGFALGEKWIVLTRIYPKDHRDGSEIVLWNRETNEETIISGEEHAHSLAMGGDWVAWLVSPPGDEMGPDSPGYTALYQISTGKQWRLSPAFGTDEPYIADGRWLYWQKLANPEPWQTVFDLETGKMYRFVTDSEDYKLNAWRIHGNTVAWSLYEQLLDAGDPDGMLRWRTGADPNTLMTVNAPPVPDWWNPNDSHTYTSYGMTDIDLSQ